MKKTTSPRIVRHAVTRECFFVVGTASYPVDCTDVAHTIGAGMFAGCGLVDAWPTAAWDAILTHLALPVPVRREQAQWVVKRFVQKLWSEAFERLDDSVRDRMAAHDAKVRARYITEVGESNGETRATSAARGRAVVRKASGIAYAPSAELRKQSLRGQARTLLAFFKKTKFAPATTAEAADGMVTCGLRTTTAPARIAAFYLCDWVKKGWLTRRPNFA